MAIYLVGGAVRDQLLGLSVKEKDWVVVGATSEELLRQGYQQVGKDFPVFLHPKTKEEYALARLERKTAPGYAGFAFDSSPTVTLEEDLLRRDLTVNAIAQDSQGTIIDPYHGVDDLKKKILRHVSAAFIEDPVRILRLARFAARFATLGFTVAPKTNQLMQHMVQNGEINALVPERVWQEFHKALAEPTPTDFFTVLKNCNALSVVFPEFVKSYDQLIAHLNIYQKTNHDPLLRFSAIMQLLTIDQINSLGKRLAVPKDYLQYALLVKNNFNLLQTAHSTEAILKLFEQIDAFRRPERWQIFTDIGLLLSSSAAKQIALLNHLLAAARNISIAPFLEQGLQNKALGEAIRNARLAAVNEILTG
ncbi:MAG: multifunctional CCA tRNA nucleotidyl transferase/2'3'-cyclic phosphodiesterase/2'nucleotidase/phosphatase [Gammaproteobacteria bacterium]|nr:multifunctional CCA tRNA nucleotidyl transferase/2'3'-cyclic phosphodiesterase/2'nucleotidase/phosphatase [Gammaproteobacteria bacterium]